MTIGISDINETKLKHNKTGVCAIAGYNSRMEDPLNHTSERGHYTVFSRLRLKMIASEINARQLVNITRDQDRHHVSDEWAMLYTPPAGMPSFHDGDQILALYDSTRIAVEV